jgi:hypothetical protein
MMINAVTMGVAVAVVGGERDGGDDGGSSGGSK